VIAKADIEAAGDVEAAYRQCEALTRAQAANFFYGIRLLAGERRRAMCAVYAFARRVDDVGDGTLAREEKLRYLDAEARALVAPAPGGDAVMVALADARRRFPMPGDALDELIEGVRMDVAGTSYEDFEQLLVYCRRVAGGIGRLCLAIFGLRGRGGDIARARAERQADDLGVALQLTNILRDMREDAENGRVYLPAEDLRRFGVAVEDRPAAGALLATLDTGDGLASLVRFECQRAREWFDRGIALTRVLDRRSAACVLAMAGIYRRLLDRIDAHPEAVGHRRVSLPAHEKAWVAARGMLGVGA
jgi:15-cis-phytoene synthase